MRIKMLKDKHPFNQQIQIYTEGATVQNRFGGDSIELNALELSIYDTIIGCEQFQDYKNVRLGLCRLHLTTCICCLTT